MSFLGDQCSVWSAASSSIDITSATSSAQQEKHKSPSGAAIAIDGAALNFSIDGGGRGGCSHDWYMPADLERPRKRPLFPLRGLLSLSALGPSYWAQPINTCSFRCSIDSIAMSVLARSSFS